MTLLPVLTAEHLRYLTKAPDSETLPVNGMITDNITVMSRLQELGLVQYHPNVQTPDKGANNTWTRTKGGDLAVHLMLRYLEAWCSGEDLD